MKYLLQKKLFQIKEIRNQVKLISKRWYNFLLGRIYFTEKDFIKMFYFLR